MPLPRLPHPPAPIWRWLPGRLPRRCLLPPLAWSRPSRRLSPITSSARTPRRWWGAWKALPTNSPPFSADSSKRGATDMGMGAATGRGGGGGRGRRGRKKAVMSEINITPMVDVMLVLLIIFMVAAPMMTVGVPVDLPQTAANEMPSQTQPITVAVTPEGVIYVDDDIVAEADLTSTLTSMGANGAEDRIFLRGDTTADYGSVMRVMGILSAAGFSKIGLITEREPG